MEKKSPPTKTKVGDPLLIESAIKKLKIAHELKEKQNFDMMLREARDAVSLLGRSGSQLEYRIEALILESYAYDRLSDYRKADETSAEALRLAKTASINMRYKADACWQYGWVQLHASHNKIALRYIERALSMYESINDPEGIANSCRILGAIHADYLNYEKAVVYSQKAARIYEELKMETKRWQVLYNICIYKMDQGLVKDALKDLLDCLAFFRKTGNNYMVCRTLHRLGVNYLQLGKLSEGITSLDKARSFGYKTGDQVIIAECKCYTIEALVGKGDLVGADNLVVDLFSNPINNLAIETQTRVWKARGVLYAAQGRYKNAETDFKEAEKNAKEYELEYLLPDIYIDWAKARLRAKKMAGAQELFGKARTIFQKYNLTIREVEMDGIISHAVEQPVFRNE